MSSATPRLSRGGFQLVTLLLLALPAGITWWLGPRAFAAFGGGAAGVLGVLLVLLGAVIVWAVAIVPLRRLTDLPSFADDFGARNRRALAQRLADERVAQAAAAQSADPRVRRRYHFRIAAAGAVITTGCAVATLAMLLDASGVLFLALPAAALASAGVTVYHLARGLAGR